MALFSVRWILGDMRLWVGDPSKCTCLLSLPRFSQQSLSLSSQALVKAGASISEACSSLAVNCIRCAHNSFKQQRSPAPFNASHSCHNAPRTPARKPAAHVFQPLRSRAYAVIVPYLILTPPLVFCLRIICMLGDIRLWLGDPCLFPCPVSANQP